MTVNADTEEATTNTSAQAAPRVWVVTGYRAGERVQILALAEALGWAYEIKDVDYLRGASTLSLFRLCTRQGLYRAGSAKLNGLFVLPPLAVGAVLGLIGALALLGWVLFSGAGNAVAVFWRTPSLALVVLTWILLDIFFLKKVIFY